MNLVTPAPSADTRAPTVSALLVTWNSLELLPACLSALRAQEPALAEIVVVDNGSTDGTVEHLREQPDVDVVANPANLGFAAANNQAIAASTGEVVLLVNADAVLEPGYVAACVAHFRRPEVGSVTGRLVRPDPPGVLDSTGHNVFSNGWAENRGELLEDSGFDAAEEVFGVCAAAALYRRAALDDVAVDGQVFDETYFSYIEDVDLDWRLRWRGWRAWYEPRARAIHHRSASGAPQSARVMRHILVNRLLTVVKNYDRRSLVVHGPGVAAFTVAKTIDFARRRPSAVLGLADAVGLLPVAMRRRRAIAARRRVAPGEVRRWLLPFPWRDRVRRRLNL